MGETGFRFAVGDRVPFCLISLLTQISTRKIVSLDKASVLITSRLQVELFISKSFETMHRGLIYF